MLMTYWMFHLFFTIPPTLTLLGVLRPMLSPADSFRYCFLTTVAVLYTLPWDSYIIYHKAWSYAPWAVTATIFGVPIEEVFFFIIQTFLTGYLYNLFTFPLLPSLYLLPKPNSFPIRYPHLWSFIRWSPSFLFGGFSILSWIKCQPNSHQFYITCIGFWASPICCFLWTIAGDHILLRPTSIIYSILLPTIYLCATDIIALRRGIWSISTSTSLGIFVWPDLPIEEAFFFLITNTILVFGLAAFEKIEAIINTWPELILERSSAQSTLKPFSIEYVLKLSKATRLGLNLPKLINQSNPSLVNRIHQLSHTSQILRKASKSFYSASLVFSNYKSIRSKFIILYGFCRETDDLIDNAINLKSAKKSVLICRSFLNLLWPKESLSEEKDQMGFSKEKEELSSNERFEERLKNFIEENVPIQARPTFYLFSTLKDDLRREPFEELIDGYAFDALEFQQKSIESDEDLLRYSRWVAGSVGEMCVDLMLKISTTDDDPLSSSSSSSSNNNLKSILMASNDMGVALQLVNIARDIREDAQNGRIYLPTSWFKSTEGPLKPIHLSLLKSAQTDDLNQFPYSIAVNQLLSLASKFQSQSKFAIENLPKSFRPGVRAATEVYLEIGHKLQSFTTLNHPSSFHSNQLHWKGERVYLTKFHRAFIVAREIWGLPTFDSLFN
ncbi:Squalene/phytoene synthase-domain-containing protein [Melampsora americana]|nr:Squalene/phytoene synthase-domain-containing protein [Melampsora americana]